MTKDQRPKKIVLVHDWLNGMRGGEKCLEILCRLYPDAPIYTLLYEPDKVSETIRAHRVVVSWLRFIPGVKRCYRWFLPFFPLFLLTLRLPRDADAVISLSHCVAKSVRRPGIALHVCYCFSPMRYAWGLADVYFFRGRGVKAALKKLVFKPVLSLLRRWDRRTARRVDRFVAISECVRGRIEKNYGRESDVIYPPVDTDFYTVDEAAAPVAGEPFYLVVSALVPYKRIDLAVDAFNTNGRRLVIVGIGPEMERLKVRAGPNISFAGWRSDEELRRYFNRARALVFPGMEDFGIVPLEASACGLPVIAFGAGGALETVCEGESGLFFDEQSPESLNGCIARFEKLSLDKKAVRSYALPFGAKVFRERISAFVEAAL